VTIRAPGLLRCVRLVVFSWSSSEGVEGVVAVVESGLRQSRVIMP
jgi:hypothetical protein